MGVGGGGRADPTISVIDDGCIWGNGMSLSSVHGYT